MDLARRHKVLAGLAILTTLTLTACGPEEPVAVADAEGNVVGQSPVAKQEIWTGTGAYLAGTVAFEQKDMRQAADLLTLALGDDLGNGVLAQKALVALMSDGRIEEASTALARWRRARARVPHRGRLPEPRRLRRVDPPVPDLVRTAGARSPLGV